MPRSERKAMIYTALIWGSAVALMTAIGISFV